MRYSALILFLASVLALPAPAQDEPAKDTALDADAIEDAQLSRPLTFQDKGAAVLRAQVLLERAHFSPGEIDADFGSNMRQAVIGYQTRHRIEPSGDIDANTWAALNADTAPILIDYEIAEDDVAGPFVQVPDDMMQKAKLPALGFGSAAEALAEKFHSSPALLQELNPGKDLARAGERLRVPNVETEALPAAAKVVVDESDATVSLVDERGQTYAQYPATMGSEHDPLPIGEWEITGVHPDPVFHYNPALFWDADPTHAKAPIQPGPNNPVGVVWIDLSKPHYGIHGTPYPDRIGKTQSHGCIRLTNWSAAAMAAAVAPGTPAILQE